MVRSSKVRNNNYSRIRADRLNRLLIFATGHTYTEVYHKALKMGVTTRTAKGYMKTLTIHLAKRKPIPMLNPSQPVTRRILNPYDKTEEIIGSGSDIIEDSNGH